MSYNSVVPNSGKSTVSATTSVVSKDKHAIKSTKKVIEGTSFFCFNPISVGSLPFFSTLIDCFSFA